MTRRKGLGKGQGKGYRNIIPPDPNVHSLSARGIKTQQNIPPRIKQINPIPSYKKEYKALNKEFDVLWKLPDTPARSAKFKKKRMKEAYPLTHKILNYRDPNPPKFINWDYTDVVIVTRSLRNEGGHIEKISPDEFLRLAGGDDWAEDKYEFVHLSSIFWLYNNVKKTKEMPVGFIEVRPLASDSKILEVHGHEGRHRALVLKMLNFKEMPVAIYGENHEKFSKHMVFAENWRRKY